MLNLVNGLEHEFPVGKEHVARKPQGLILAAGRGRRLGATVDEVPKCLLRVGGATLLDHQLAMLNAAGIRDICVVTGYKNQAVSRACQRRAAVINNPNWADTNSLYSLWLARHWVNRDVVVMNCDVLADPSMLERLLATRASSFAYDSASGSDDEHMKVELADGRLVSMSKTLDAASVHGENVGMLHFSAHDARRLFVHAEAILESGSKTPWMASAVQRLAEESRLQAIDVCGRPWIEIDYAEDLEDARRRVWPLIEHRRARSESSNSTRHEETLTGRLCYESL